MGLHQYFLHDTTLTTTMFRIPNVRNTKDRFTLSSIHPGERPRQDSIDSFDLEAHVRTPQRALQSQRTPLSKLMCITVTFTFTVAVLLICSHEFDNSPHRKLVGKQVQYDDKGITGGWLMKEPGWGFKWDPRYVHISILRLAVEYYKSTVENEPTPVIVPGDPKDNSKLKLRGSIPFASILQAGFDGSQAPLPTVGTDPQARSRLKDEQFPSKFDIRTKGRVYKFEPLKENLPTQYVSGWVYNKNKRGMYSRDELQDPRTERPRLAIEWAASIKLRMTAEHQAAQDAAASQRETAGDDQDNTGGWFAPCRNAIRNLFTRRSSIT